LRHRAASRCDQAGTQAVLGQRPSYGLAAISELSNLAAIDRLIWMRGADEGLGLGDR
jgi:hypothetical protein